jgi:hypothetical protein
VEEYFQYDPTADYLKPSLQGFRLIEGNYLPISEQIHGDRLWVYSETLGLELWLEANGEMRFYAPKSGAKLLSPREMEQAKHQAEQAQHQAEQAQHQAEQRAAKLAAKLRELGIDPDLI